MRAGGGGAGQGGRQWERSPGRGRDVRGADEVFRGGGREGRYDGSISHINIRGINFGRHLCVIGDGEYYY